MQSDHAVAQRPGQRSCGRRRVRVWFGSHVIADYSAAPDLADQYAAAMSRRFAGLRLTVDDALAGGERPVPAERLWGVIAP